MRNFLLVLGLCSFNLTLLCAQSGVGSQGKRYFIVLDDAQLDFGIKLNAVFALDDRAPLSSNPHFQAMWNLIKLGASIEALTQGMDEPMSELNMGQEFGRNGYNKTVAVFYLRYGFGESSDLQLQRQFLEFGFSPGYFREGNNGANIYLDYRYNILKTEYGAGGASLDRPLDYEVFVGLRAGFDWSFQRSEGEAGFFQFLNEEVDRLAVEHEFTVAQLLALKQLAADSKVLMPEDVGGRAFHIGPVTGLRLSRELFSHGRIFAQGQFFYDLMDLSQGRSGEENQRSQHHIALQLGLEFAIGGEGRRQQRGPSFY